MPLPSPRRPEGKPKGIPFATSERVPFAFCPLATHKMLKALALFGLLGGAAIQASCSRSDREPPQPAAPAPVTRGQHVVVEARAAEFFEGRVLEVQADRLKVEQLDSGESHRVAIADAYVIGAGSAMPAAGQFAVCKRGAQKWQACRVEDAQRDSVRATSPTGETFSVAPSEALPASPVTVLNIRRHFERHALRRTFDTSLAKAGGPRVDPGWRAGPRERVIVRAKDGWFSAQIVEIEDDGYRVRFAADGRDGEAGRSSVIPEPPYKGVGPRRGGFVLVRPRTTAGAWMPHRVLGVDDDRVEVEDASAETRSVQRRDVVPLSN